MTAAASAIIFDEITLFRFVFIVFSPLVVRLSPSSTAAATATAATVPAAATTASSTAAAHSPPPPML